MKIYSCAQRSQEWFALRSGIVTASEVHRIVTPTGKLSKQCDDYLDRLLDEWIRGEEAIDQENAYESMYMQRGVVLEQRAREAYSLIREVDVEQVGFVTIDNGLLGCSPDGLVEQDGALELKCPAGATHVSYMRTGAIEDKYKPQLQTVLLVTQREWIDVVSYHPAYELVILRQEKDPEYQEILADALNEFVEKLLTARQELWEKYPALRQEAMQEAGSEATV